MKLHKHSEVFNQSKGEWSTIFAGENQTRLAIFTNRRMPESVEISWAPPITDRKEDPDVEVPDVRNPPVHPGSGSYPELPASQYR